MDISTRIHYLWDIVNDNFFAAVSEYPRACDNHEMCGNGRVCCMDRWVGDRGKYPECIAAEYCTQTIDPQSSGT